VKRLAIVTTHPIQYNAPLFKLLAERKNIDIKVFYTWGESVLEKKYDPGFGKVIEWDIPLLEGYEYEFLKNVSKDKGSHHFKGIDNPQIIQKINDFTPDAILIYGWSFKSHLHVLRHYKRKIPIIFRGDSTLLNETNPFKSFLRKTFLNWVYSFIDFALFVGKRNYEYYKKFGIDETKLVYAPHVVNNKFFERANLDILPSKNNYRIELNIPISSIVFLFAGKLEPTKDPQLLLDSYISAGLNNSHLVIVGNGILEQRLKNKFKAYHNIHFIDFQNQSKMPYIYSMADVFVLPSKGETWGLTVNEAMANGLAIIVSNKCGCAPDLVKENENGYVFNSGNKEDLTEAIKSIAANNDKLNSMKIESKNIITKMTLEEVSRVIESLV